MFGLGDYSAYADEELKSKASPADIAGSIYRNLYELRGYLIQISDFSQLERLAKAAVSALKKLPVDQDRKAIVPLAIFAIQSMAVEAHIYQGEFDIAVEESERALKDEVVINHPKLHLDYLNRLSIALLQRGTFNQALNPLQAALDLGSDEKAPVYGNMAWYSSLAKDYKASTYFSAKAMQAALEQGGRLGVNTLYMAESFVGLKEYSIALDWLTLGVRSGALEGDRAAIAGSLMAAARIAEEKGKARIGLNLLDQALIFFDEVTWYSEGPKFMLMYSKLLLQEGRFPEAIKSAELAIDLSGERPTNELVEAWLILSKVLSSQQQINAASAAAKKAFDAAMQVSINWSGEKYQLTSAEFARSAAEEYFVYLFKEKAPNKVIAEELSRWKGFVLRDGLLSISKNNNFGKGTVDEGIGENVFLDYFIGRRISFVVIYHGSKIRIVTINSSESEIIELKDSILDEMDVRLDSVRDNISRGKISTKLTLGLRELYDRLVLPVESEPPRYVYVSPDNAIASIPWSALLNSENNYLGEKSSVLVVPGAFFFNNEEACTPEECSSSKNRVGLVGRVGSTSFVDDDGVNVSLNALSHSRKEISIIRSVWKGKLVELTDLQVPAENHETLSWLNNNVGGFYMLQVIGHGAFNHADPAGSRIYIGPFEGKLKRPYLTAQQLSTVNFRGLPLVMLGACESGTIDGIGGGEAQGLVRAFLLGGVSQVIASQWLVDDNATLVLSTELHQGLKSKKTIDAFHDAQLTVKQKYEHPYFWASFQMYGRPVGKNQSFNDE